MSFFTFHWTTEYLQTVSFVFKRKLRFNESNDALKISNYYLVKKKRLESAKELSTSWSGEKQEMENTLESKQYTLV